VQELEPGSHLVTARAGYTHHGIYVGDGMVVQYGGLARGVRGGSVEEIPLHEFAGRRRFWVKSGQKPRFDGPEIVRRARSRVGEDRYDLLTNNCEHVCEWALHGEARSFQVDLALGFPRLVGERIQGWLLRAVQRAFAARRAGLPQASSLQEVRIRQD
jgi:hypothetical protein